MRHTDKYAALTPQDQGKRAELVDIRFVFHRFSPFFCDFYRSKVYLKRSFSLLKNRTPACHLERRKHHKLVFSKPKPDHREGDRNAVGSRGELTKVIIVLSIRFLC